MNLLEVRTQFVKVSGRYDLVTSPTIFTDNGANYFIQAGQDMLERLVGTLPDSEGRIWKTLPAGGYYLSFQKRCRAIKEIWVNSSTERYRLRKVDWEELKAKFNTPILETDKGAPLYFCPAKLREVDVEGKDKTGIFFNYTLADSKDYRGILVLPPTDTDYDIEVLGMFYQPKLYNEEDTNVWTILYPDALVKAAVYQLELFYKDRHKLKGLFDGLSLDILEIGKDVVEEEISDIVQMEG
jgi:hypothetical protein